MLFNIYFSTEFDARMQEMAFPGFYIPKFSGGACPQTTLGGGALWPLKCYRRLL